MTTAAITAPDSTVRDFVALVKCGLRFAGLTGITITLFASTAYAQSPTCVTNSLSLLQNIQQSDAIIQAYSHKPSERKWIKDGDSYSDEFEVIQVLYGSGLKPNQSVRVWWSNQKQELETQKNVSNLNFFFAPTAPVKDNPEDKDRSAYFLLKKAGNDYCIMLNLYNFKTLTQIDPYELLHHYLQFKDQPQPEQALELLKLLIQMAEMKANSGGNFPISILLYDWDLVKSKIDPKKAELLVTQAFPAIIKNDAWSMPLVTFMTPPQKRSIISIMLAKHDAYMQEQKDFCNKPLEAKPDKCGGNGLPCEMSIAEFEWMNKCMPPTDHESMAMVLGIPSDINQPAPVIKAAREFVASGPLEPYSE